MGKKVDILAIGVHPDDVELSAAGTLLRQQSLGRSFALLDLTLGELGSRGSAALRTLEATRAAEILGAAARTQLDLGDGFFQPDKDATLQIIQQIRYFQPDIILCNALSDRHPDHGRAAKMVADAAFYSGLLKIATTEPDSDQSQQPWRPRAVYHYIQDNNLIPDFVVDIGPFFQQKMSAIYAYESQFFNINDTDGVKTPISGPEFIHYMEAKARIFGRPIQVEFAEGFQFSRTPGVDDLFDLK